jgi:thiamine-phosphate pyrophosphorylase
LILYYITDRMQFPGREAERQKRLLQRIEEAARSEIDFIQLREKDLRACDLEVLAREAAKRVQAAKSRTRLLINSRTDVALAAGADGVHLRSRDVSPVDVRSAWRSVASPESKPLVGVSCHTEVEVSAAAAGEADFVVFGPVFEKRENPQAKVSGSEKLRGLCQFGVRVLALGGITPGNAGSCIKNGAAGIAGIRIFQEGNLDSVVQALRG